MNDAIKLNGELTIGGLAKAAGVNVETIRYYERIGLIEQPSKPGQGFRKYPQQTIQNIRFIKRAQELGFNLQEISELLLFGEGHCEDMRQRAEVTRNRIESQVKDLIALRDGLDELITACRHRKDELNCPIVQTLQGKHSGVGGDTGQEF